jgi:hypothetical protein
VSRLVAINVGGSVEVHACGREIPGDYDTLCGVDANDPAIGHFGIVDLPKGAKIDCQQCRGIFEATRALRRTDFASQQATAKEE